MKTVDLYVFGFRSFTTPSVRLWTRTHRALRHIYNDFFHLYNFGDYLSYYIVKAICADRVELVEKDHKNKLLAIGSIISAVQDGDYIWGAGALGNEIIPYRKNLTIKAVRGPLTAEVLKRNNLLGHQSTDILYFDPAVLISIIHPELKAIHPKTDSATVVIPHYANLKYLTKWKSQGLLSGTTRLISPLSHPLYVAKSIRRAHRVISSSLHGLIIAEALGIEAVPFRLATSHEPVFKYEDYYEGTGRVMPRFATDLKEALAMRGKAKFPLYSPEKMASFLKFFSFDLKKEIQKLFNGT
jgi:pyruvyltransferase